MDLYSNLFLWRMKLLRGEFKWVPKMEVNVEDKFELDNFRPTVASKSEVVVCLYFYQ